MNIYPISPVILDGGLGTTLEELSQNTQTPLWSTQPILDNPEAVFEAHLAFLRAGARIILTSTYQATVDAVTGEGYSPTQAKAVLIKSVQIANKARETFVNENNAADAPVVKIALSLGPFGATLTPPQEFDGYYPPPFGPMGFSETKATYNSFEEENAEGEQASIDALSHFHLDRLLVFAQDPETWSMIDIIAFETVPLVREALAIRKAMLSLGNISNANMVTVEKAWWISFVFPDGRCPQKSLDGQNRTLHDIVQAALSPVKASDPRPLPMPTGIGINCTALEYIPSLLLELHHAMTSISYHPWLVLYPNGGDIYDIKTRSWKPAPGDSKNLWAVGLTNALKVVQQEHVGIWSGIVIGGCCRAGPDLIGKLSEGILSV